MTLYPFLVIEAARRPLSADKRKNIIEEEMPSK
jgi:hypothetical protein